MHRSIAALWFAILGSAITGCATVETVEPTAATAAPAAKMDYVTALRAVTRWGVMTPPGGWSFIERAGYPVANESGVTVAFKRGGAYHCLYKDTPKPIIAKRLLASPPTFVSLNCRGTNILIWDSEAESQKLVAAWLTMVGGPPTDSPEKTAAFEAAAERYRANPTAFVIPEAARAFKVQAETAIRDKRLWDAVDRFGKALDISPAWAAGRFNLALVYGELELPGLAISEMNKYLKLVPDAKNVRAAQDKVYEWQDKTKR